jgi:hypothetical protein
MYPEWGEVVDDLDGDEGTIIPAAPVPAASAPAARLKTAARTRATGADGRVISVNACHEAVPAQPRADRKGKGDLSFMQYAHLYEGPNGGEGRGRLLRGLELAVHPQRAAPPATRLLRTPRHGWFPGGDVHRRAPCPRWSRAPTPDATTSPSARTASTCGPPGIHSVPHSGHVTFASGVSALLEYRRSSGSSIPRPRAPSSAPTSDSRTAIAPHIGFTDSHCPPHRVHGQPFTAPERLRAAIKILLSANGDPTEPSLRLSIPQTFTCTGVLTSMVQPALKSTSAVDPPPRACLGAPPLTFHLNRDFSALERPLRGEEGRAHTPSRRLQVRPPLPNGAAS